MRENRTKFDTENTGGESPNLTLLALLVAFSEMNTAVLFYGSEEEMV